MNPIISPLQPNASGPSVAKLQDTLLALLNRKTLRPHQGSRRATPKELQKLAAGLKRERAQARFGPITARLAKDFQAQLRLKGSRRGAVDVRTAARLDALLPAAVAPEKVAAPGKASVLRVRGTVTTAGGQPVRGAIVRAFDRDLRKEQPLGEAATNPAGKYLISYRPAQFLLGDEPTATAPKLIVRLFVDGRQIGADVSRPKPQRVEVVDFTVPAATASEWEQLSAGVMPLLAGQGDGDAALPPWEVTDGDLDFLAEESGLDREKIRLWTLAFAAARDAAADLQSASVTGATTHVVFNPSDTTGRSAFAVFYGWFRQGLPTAWAQLRTRRIATLRQALIDSIDQNIIPAAFRDQVDQILAHLPFPNRDQLQAVLGTATLGASARAALLDRADAPAAVSNSLLTELTAANVITPAEARSVGLSVSVSRLAPGDAALATGILGAVFDSLGGGKPQQARDLAALEPEEWLSVITQTGASIPAGTSPADYARSLALTAAGAFPNAALLSRAVRVPAHLDVHLNAIQPLLKIDPNALEADFDQLPLDGISDAERAALRAAHDELQRLANLHPGLGLFEVMAVTGGATDAAATVAARIGWLQQFQALNPGANFLGLNYLPGSADLAALNFGPLEADARTRVVADLKAYQRIQTVTGNGLAARDVLAAGYHSASAVARSRVDEFTARTGLGEREARAYRAAARTPATDAALRWTSVFDTTRDATVFNNPMLPSVDDFFPQLPGYAELFGPQTFCHCLHCQSVLSPAAYFVDLMYYIEQNILATSFAGQESHPLHLKVRRPDLWTLPLTCANTEEYLPLLDVVNEILETYIQAQLTLPDAAAVYAMLAQQESSFQQPFTLPLERLEVLLGHFALSRADLAKAMAPSSDTAVRARLHLAKNEYDLIVTSRLINIPPISNLVGDIQFFQKLFGVYGNWPTFTIDNEIDPPPLQPFVTATGLDRTTIEAVLAAAAVNGDGSANPPVEIVIGVIDPAGNVQNNAEEVHHLSVNRLDRIHRFVRLWRRLPWTVTELDYVLQRLQANALATGLGPDALRQISRLLELNAGLALPVDEFLALWDLIPRAALRDDVALFDRLFNQASFVSKDGPWPAAGLNFVHPATNPDATAAGTSVPKDNTLTRLLAGLQVSDKELVSLITRLAAPLNLTNGAIALTEASLNLLYRHARLARQFNVSVDDLFLLTGFGKTHAWTATAVTVDGLPDLETVAAFASWQSSAGSSLAEIAYITGGPLPTGAPDPNTTVGRILAKVAAEKSLQFADTVFTQIGLTDAQSRTIIADNLGAAGVADGKAFEPLADGLSYRLKAGFDPALPANVITLDPAITADPATLAAHPHLDADVRDLLGRYHALRVLDVALGSALNRLPEEGAQLRALVRPGFSAADATAITQSLQGDPDVTLLTSLVTDLLRWRALFKSSVFDAPTLAFAGGNRAVFALPADPVTTALTTDAVRAVAAYAALATPTDTGFSTAADPVNAASLQAVLVAGVSAATDDDLAQTLRTDVARIKALRPHLPPPPAGSPFDGLATISRCLALTELLGVSGETLQLAASDDFTDLTRAAEDVYGAFRAKYPDEATFLKQIEPYDDTLRGRKRDGLVGYMTTAWSDPFATPSSLYEYFLIDVQMSGAARTSRVVAGVSSLQLYVQRVLMNLERSSDYDGSMPPTQGVYARFTDPDKRAEWYWRQNYRVWEANRKVFLYPENYLEPELRDDKTPLFKELENTLLQQDITEQNVLDAYSKYLAGFEEVARLQIAGAYHDNYHDNTVSRDVLHLFGATPGDAPVYYYRAITGVDGSRPQFGPWIKMNAQIPVRVVSPIIFQGRLYVFWVEITTQPQNKIEGGTSIFGGYRHKVAIKYVALRLDNTWTAPQTLQLTQGIFGDSVNTINDPAVFPSRWVLVTSGSGAAAADLDLADSDLKKRTRLALAMVYADLKTIRADDFVITDAQDGPVLSGGVKTYSVTVSLVTSWKLTIPNPASPKWGQAQTDSSDDYTLTGFEWDRVYPYVNDQGQLVVQFGVFQDGSAPRFTGVVQLAGNEGDPIAALQLHAPQLLLGVSGTDLAAAPDPGGQMWTSVVPYGHSVLATEPDALIGYTVSTGQPPLSVATGLQPKCALAAINGSSPPTGVLLATDRDLLYLFARQDWNKFYLRRLGSTVPDKLVAQFGGGGPGAIDALLDLSYQQQLTEDPLPFTAVPGLVLPEPPAPQPPWDPTDLAYLSKLAYTGAFGTYYREVFFHVPFLIANHLNGQQQFAACQRWYHRIFNPAAIDRIPWRYAEFPSQFDPKAENLRKILTDTNALEAYRNDPFNPHAIARVRLSAYQKAIVMKYVDNLLDWADSLFTQFTMESINEATMLYVMASDILGPRPPELGSCGEGSIAPKTYENLRPALSDTSDFLIELENMVPPIISWPDGQIVIEPNAATNPPPGGHLHFAVRSLGGSSGTGGDFDMPGGPPPVFGGNAEAGSYWTTTGGVPLADLEGGGPGVDGFGPPIVGTGTGAPPFSGNVGGNIDFVQGFEPQGYVPVGDTINQFDTIPGIAQGQRGYPQQQIPGLGGPSTSAQPVELVAAKLVFCIPENTDLLAYWDRVEQRLFNIRNCMDIAGVRRQPALFAPEIDPRLLVRLTAAGLSLDDVLNATSGDLPPYRFLYLIDKARQHAATVQSFGSQLQAAMEKRDAEELAQLRAVHEQNLLKLREQAVQREIDAAEDTLQSLNKQKDTAQHRRDHFDSLRKTGLSDWEIAQATATVAGSTLLAAEAIMKTIGAVVAATPNAGAPTAMTYGGRELSSSLGLAAGVMEALANIAQTTASATGMAATFDRRAQDWNFQVEAAQHEMDQIDRQISAAQFRKEIAENALTAHQKSIDQAEEVYAFYGDKFTSLGRFDWLSTQLHRLYRMAYYSAFGLAKLAEQAFLFERPDDTGALLGDGYWDAGNAGLLAGEQILLALQAMERRFVETNYRKLEVEQAFSLVQFAGDKLIDLRRDGTCSFQVPELFFDLYYPGHYRRVIKAVRLTIPCVTGPYNNVGAMLRLTGSQWRRDATADPSALVAVPLRHTVTVAASTAQNDSGVFEFSFRDERFMPFEGAGAISEWTLELPDKFRAFDYDTISDVILRISYTAEEDSGYRDKVEAATGVLLTQLQAQPLKRLFSLRHEFPTEWARFKNTPANADGYVGLTVTLRPEQYPFWTQGLLNTVKSAALVPETSGAGLVIAADAAGTTSLLASGTGYDLGASAPATPTSPVTIYIKDPNGALDELWLLVEWSK